MAKEYTRPMQGSAWSKKPHPRACRSSCTPRGTDFSLNQNDLSCIQAKHY